MASSGGKTLLTAFFICLLTLSAQAAVVYLKDGSQVHGTVVSATARDIELFTPHGTLHINADQIVRIDYAENESKPPPSSEPTSPPTQTPPSPAPAYEPPVRPYHRRRPPPPDRWSEEGV